jgi:hypothetical protein
MDLYLWKAPVIDDPDEARALIDRYFDNDEKGVFEPSPAIAALAEELRRLYPIRYVPGEELVAGMSEEERSQYTEEGLSQLREAGSYTQDEDGPWADLPLHQREELLALNIRWSADNAVLDRIVELAKAHDLVIYDPQGPDVYRAVDAGEAQADEKPTAKDFLSVMLLFLPIAGATLAAWWFIPWGWLRWPLVAIGIFFTIAAAIVVYSTIEAALQPDGPTKTG